MNLSRKTEAFEQAATSYLSAAELQRQVLAELLELTGEQSWQQVLDVGCGPGTLLESQPGRFQDSCVIGIDRAQAMASEAVKHGERAIVADMEALPVLGQSQDLVIASMSLHWAASIPYAITECWRCVRGGGAMLISMPVQPSLRGLAKASQEAWQENVVHDFPQLQQLASWCQALPDLNQSQQKLFSQKQPMPFEQMLRQFKALGVVNRRPERHKGLRSRGQLDAFCKAYTKHSDNALQWEIALIACQKI